MEHAKHINEHEKHLNVHKQQKHLDVDQADKISM